VIQSCLHETVLHKLISTSFSQSSRLNRSDSLEVMILWCPRFAW